MAFYKILERFKGFSPKTGEKGILNLRIISISIVNVVTLISINVIK